MGFFGTKKAPEETKGAATPEVKKDAKKSVPRKVMPHDVASALVKPRITEKAALLLEKDIYTFEVRKGVSKYDVRDAIVSLYKVTPVQIRMVNQAPRRYVSKMRGREMKVSGLKKAYVYLKKGDRIDLV